PEQVKARFELEKIEVVPEAGGAQEFAYFFKDGNGPITENEFVSRSADMTGGTELKGAGVSHPWPIMALGVLAIAGGVALIADAASRGIGERAVAGNKGSLPTGSSGCDTTAVDLGYCQDKGTAPFAGGMALAAAGATGVVLPI